MSTEDILEMVDNALGLTGQAFNRAIDLLVELGMDRDEALKKTWMQ